MSEQRERITYRDAGVDIDAQDEALARIKHHLKSTKTLGVLSDLGSFGGMFALPGDIEQPVLVASTDGVGTKLMLAWMTGRHDTVGQCLVNHCVNDILVQGARPLFFLDYFATAKLQPTVFEQVVAGIAAACRENRCALIGGETAELPEMYKPGEYDLAGTIVGIVSRPRVLTGSKVAAGDSIFGLRSTGLHTNGYSLARRVLFGKLKLEPSDRLPGETGTVADALLAVHKSYLTPLEPALAADQVSALAHITGGGLTDNIPRVLPATLDAEIDLGAWKRPRLFELLIGEGGVPEADALRTFNLGIGMVAVVPAAARDPFVAGVASRSGETPLEIGTIVSGTGKVRYRGSLSA